MPTTTVSQQTDFSKDVLGRYMCNGLDEALHSTDKNAFRPDGSPQSDARPFNAIVIGGGSFGSIFAQHLLYADKTNSYRILVLEGGPFVLPEHVQNLPLYADLAGEVWGLPWQTNVDKGFPGLAYCIGGRSLFFGGWSPQLLEEEMKAWPNTVKTELKNQYFSEASEQIGTDSTNDFMHGALHEALRDILYQAITQNQITDAIPLNELPLHLNLDGNAPPNPEILKLEAPLAVQGRQPRAGYFPINKFSAAPLLMESARVAQAKSRGDDVKKRLMVVPDCHVTRLVTSTQNGQTTVKQVLTNRGSIPVADDAVVVIALGTIESTRLAQISFPNIPNALLMGQNLMAHLRSNLTIRIPRNALPANLPSQLETSALFVKGRHKHTDGTYGYFHLQITASGLDKPSTDSEAELFKKIPDIDTIQNLRQTTDNNVVITIRSIGQMEAQNPDSNITLSGALDENGMPRAYVKIHPSTRDFVLWNAMEQAAADVAQAFAGNGPFEIIANGRDGLGTTHHEAGTLWMGEDPNTSVTNPDGQFHFVTNAYVAGPATFPSLGSPNPMLTGTALARRLGNHLKHALPQPELGYTLLFDGTTTDKVTLPNGQIINEWKMSMIKNQPGRNDPGRFTIVDGALESVTGNDLGLLYTEIPYEDYSLKLEWLSWREDDNSGIFIRFSDPESKGYSNNAFVAVDFGIEIQIDALARNDGAAIHKTGAIYGLQGPQDPNNLPVNPVGQWNQYEIQAKGNQFKIFLNGQLITDYTNLDPNRAVGTAPGFIGLQTHTGRVAFRNIQIKPL